MRKSKRVFGKKLKMWFDSSVLLERQHIVPVVPEPFAYVRQLFAVGFQFFDYQQHHIFYLLATSSATDQVAAYESHHNADDHYRQL